MFWKGNPWGLIFSEVNLVFTVCYLLACQGPIINSSRTFQQKLLSVLSISSQNLLPFGTKCFILETCSLEAHVACLLNGSGETLCGYGLCLLSQCLLPAPPSFARYFPIGTGLNIKLNIQEAHHNSAPNPISPRLTMCLALYSFWPSLLLVLCKLSLHCPGHTSVTLVFRAQSRTCHKKGLCSLNEEINVLISLVHLEFYRVRLAYMLV